MKFLAGSSVNNLIFTGDAGKRMLDISAGLGLPADKKYIMARDFDEAVFLAVKNSKSGSICLLSPAASSYDAFRNFEERGLKFRELVEKFTSAS